jgi:hypothetical protein
MAQYKVRWKIQQNSPYENEQVVEAHSVDDALKLTIDKSPYPQHQYIQVVSYSVFGSEHEEDFSNPHFEQVAYESPIHAHSGAPVIATPVPINSSNPEQSGWAVFHTIIGGIATVFGLILIFVSIDEGEQLLSAIIILCAGIANLFAAFMINVQTDIRHYLKEIAATQNIMSESFERLEGRGDS